MTTRPDDARSCARCTHFDGDARSLEARIAGLRTFGSGFASVRDDDGLCARHERFAAAHATCAEFAPVAQLSAVSSGSVDRREKDPAASRAASLPRVAPAASHSDEAS